MKRVPMLIQVNDTESGSTCLAMILGYYKLLNFPSKYFRIMFE